MDVKLMVALGLGTLCMFGVMMISRKQYPMVLWKRIITAPVLTLFGFLSVKLWYFLENGRWGGLSFFGAVLLIPIWFLLVAWILRESYPKLLDTCAPPICVMLALMKIYCLICGCCGGRVLYTTEAGSVIRFPSQIVEMLNALVLMAVLLWIIRKGKHQGEIYPIFMVLYGITRFLWNLFRETTPMVGILAAGNVWALVAVAIGIFWLVLRSVRGKKITDQPKEV